MTILHLLLGRLVHSLALQPGMRVRHFSTSTARQEERGLHVIINSGRRDTVTIFRLFLYSANPILLTRCLRWCFPAPPAERRTRDGGGARSGRRTSGQGGSGLETSDNI